MSLYYETATILENKNRAGGSLKSRVYNSSNLKSSPGSIYALATKATQWADVLKDVIERSGLLAFEKKLTPHLALLLAHDILLAKEGIAAPKNHVLSLAISRHKARLSAELTRVRLKRGFGNIEELQTSLNTPLYTDDPDSGANVKAINGTGKFRHPRWIRINTLKTTLDEQLTTTFQAFTRVGSLQDILKPANGSNQNIYIDTHIPNLIALPPVTDLTRSSAYRTGQVILQDKASCFPAYLLNPQPSDGDLIDACAAPGNKTTHLVALLYELAPRSGDDRPNTNRHIFACERNSDRAATLTSMLDRAGAGSPTVTVLNKDFLALYPAEARFARVTALLLDPSCSGSGMIDRSDGEDETSPLALPSREAKLMVALGMEGRKGRKRKRSKGTGGWEEEKKDEEVAHEKGSKKESQVNANASPSIPTAHEIPVSEAQPSSLSTRLAALSAFQTRLLTHAFRFPSARRIVYSTCSVHCEENEAVVARALDSDIARSRGWRVLRREEQVVGMREWRRRGLKGDGGEWGEEVVQGSVRCEKGTAEGTMGFFVCGFVRDGQGEGEREGGWGDDWDGLWRETENGDTEGAGEEAEEEWQGFSDENEN
ncbi:MAG: hypothetical protein M1821_010033 [Bathelium mastoideum]|nr:MAG: hypothetical protein M1821_010033 [Bathelium mastoideum]